MDRVYLPPFIRSSVRRLRTNVRLLIALIFLTLASSTAIITAQSPHTASALAAFTAIPAQDHVSIPSIGLTSRYIPVGVTAENKIDVHPSLIGRYTGTAQPGDRGAVFLDGHNPGVFSRLDSIEIGASITITQANGKAFNYTVVHTETVPLIGIDMRKALQPYNGADEGLNIMTCAGTYSEQLGTTDQRFVVYAVRS